MLKLGGDVGRRITGKCAEYSDTRPQRMNSFPLDIIRNYCLAVGGKNAGRDSNNGGVQETRGQRIRERKCPLGAERDV